MTDAPHIPIRPTETSLRADIVAFIRYHLRGRRGLVAAAALVIAIGLGLNWSWLAAAGLAPLLLSLIPCTVMCALGLCMMHKNGQSSCGDHAATHETAKAKILPPAQHGKE